MDNRNAIAIIGMSCRFPGAPDVRTFWENLRHGIESVRRFSDAELAAAGVDESVRHDPAYVSANGALQDIDQFDAAFFNITPRDAEIMDPQHRVFLECAWEALEAGGYRPGRDAGRVGVFAGAGISTYLLNNLLPRKDLLARIGDIELLLANNKDYVPTRVAYKLDLAGPAVSANTACSTGLVNVHLACQSLLSFECDMALAGGVSIQVPEDRGYLHQPDGILSPDGHCRAFDARAAGTVSGNGAGVVLLKRLEEAVADGDHIHAVILATAINNDGADKAGFTAPSASGQADVIAQALATADIPAETIAYVEAHGTGTQVGDPIEVAALTEVFRARTSATQFCAIGSVKTNFGHLDEAAGIAGLIKTALALEHAVIPPTLHCATPNAALQLDSSPFVVATGLRDWPDRGFARRAAVSSFGLGGTNAHAILEQAPAAKPSESSSRQLLVLSARSVAALDAMSERLAGELERSPAPGLADVAFTLLAGRRRFAHRRVISALDRDDAISVLRGAAPERSATSVDDDQARDVVFMFPGQGVASAGMSRSIYEREPVFRQWLDRSAEVLRPQIGVNIRDVIFGQGGALQGSALAQPALFAVEYALAQFWISRGVVPAAMIGHSLGEYVAACLAGTFTFEDALGLVADRGAIMSKAPRGSMLAVALDESSLRSRLSPDLDLAVVTAPGMCVIAGPAHAIDAFRERAESDGVECRRVELPIAAHSSLMNDAAAELRARIAQVQLSAPRLRYVSNVTGTWITAADATSPEYWARQMRHTVRFSDGIDLICRTLPRPAFLEVGPGRSLSGPVLRHPSRKSDAPVITSMRHAAHAADDHAILNLALGRLWASGVTVDAARLFDGTARKRVPLPTYPFERQRFWIDALPASTVSPPVKRANVGDWLYVPSWRRSIDPTTSQSVPKFITVIGAGMAIAEHTVDRLRADGHHVTLLEATRSAPPLIDADAVIDLRACRPVADATSAAAELFAGLLAVAQSLARSGGERSTTLTVVTTGAAQVADDDPLEPCKCVVFGLVHSLEQEHPSIRCRAIDVDSVDRDAITVSRLIAETLSDTGDRLVALRGRHRWCRDYAAATVSAPPALKERGVYLITGGIGDVGAAIARVLAKKVRATLILVSRTRALDPALRVELEQAGATVWVRSIDVADSDAMRGLLGEITTSFGRLDGVIHAAGVTTPDVLFRSVEDTDEEQVRAIFRPKVEGTLVLERLLRERPIDFCLLISSNASTLGGLGLSAYGAASHVLDAVATRCRQAGLPWTSSNWDGWPSAKPDPLSASSRQSGIEAFTMSPAEAEDALLRVLASATERVVISSGDLHTRLQRWIDSSSAVEPGSTAPNSASDQKFDGTVTEVVVAAAIEDVIGARPSSAHDNFFELGGDSLSGSRMMARLSRRLAVPLSVRMIFAEPTVAGIATQIDRARDGGTAAVAAITRIPDARSYAVSSAQRRLWILHEIDKASAAYHVSLHQWLDGPLDRDALVTAIRSLVTRHESLRTTFSVIDGEPRQIIHPTATLALDQHDVSDAADPESAARALILTHARPFDLERGPLVRATLIQLAADRHALLFTMHHIVADGVSINVIGRDLARLYESARTGARDSLSPPAIQYRDFAAWQNARLEGAAAEPERDYWHAKLGGTLPVIDLIEDLPRPAVLTTNGREPMFDISADVTAALSSLGQRRNASLFMVLLAALKTYLYRATGQTDVIIGSPSAGRVHADLDDQVGCFLNTLALRDQLEPRESFEQLLDQVRVTATEALEHQEYPFERLVTELQLPRDASRSPIFDVVMILQNDVENALTLPGITARPLGEDNHTAKVDLSFNFKPNGDGLAVGVEYNADLYLPERIAAMAAQFQELLRSIVDDPARAIDALPMMSQADRQQVVATFNDSWMTRRADSVIDLFEAKAAQQPDAIAAHHRNQRLSYRELNDRANRLARHFSMRASLGAGDVAIIAVPSGFDLVASLLAVLKLRAAAVLIEPSIVPERLTKLIADSRCKVVISAESLVDPAIDMQSTAPIDSSARSADDDVLVFFTSGSTGTPKGVRLTNRGIVNELDWFARYFAMTADDVLPQKTVLTFADCIAELLVPITITGGAVHLRPDYSITADLTRLAEWFGSSGATMLQFVPEVFEELSAEIDVAKLTRLRALILSGSAVRRQQIYPFKVFNLYGCSETSALATYQDISQPTPLARVPIGKPLQNTSIYILDTNMAPCPLFVPGEIFVGGDTVAAGYLHNQSMTGERFVPNPFVPGDVLFRTGDFGRWYSDGTIDYLGRRDEQVKIRGQRIECGAVAHALCAHPAISEAVVTVRAAGGREPQLVAYVVASPPIERGAVRAFLSAELPDYMIPAVVMTVAALPRTSSGKLDHKALPEPQPAVNTAAMIAPRNATEAAIAEIWRDVLEIEVVGIHDDFLALGGHSLKATRVASRVVRDLGLNITLTDVFRHPTIAALAEAAQQRAPQGGLGIRAVTDADAIAPLTAAERELLG